MGRTNVRVVARARPTSSFASDIFKFNEAADSIDMRLPKDESAGLVNNQQETWHFKLDKVLSNGSQEQIFEICAADVVRSVMDGYNGTILAYGQTGAGKTHTMSGGHMGFADRGIVPRAISAIYSEAAARPENNITIKLSYVEIYNELMFDLLTDVGVAEQSGDLSIVEDSRGNIQVRGLTTPVGGTEEEALHIFFQGDTNRHVAEHALNKGSTRSHVVFTIYVESRSRVESSEKVIFSKLHLVDLAGSERVKKTGSDGVMLKEATFINKSLTFLEQVVVALGNKHRDHIPYRQSKLTHILKDSLGGNCKTTMVANIWPEGKMLEETASTLRFATRMMKVSNEASVNVHLDPQLLIRKYERQIKDLKQELAMHDTLAGRSRVQYEEYAPDEQKELQDKVQMYLEGDLQEIEVTSLRMVYESYAIFRKLYQNLRTELANRPTVPLPPQGGDVEAGDGGQTTTMEAESLWSAWSRSVLRRGRMRAFREILAKSKNVVVLTGSGVSAESGVPTFRYTVKPPQSVNTGPENLWRKRCITELATPETFHNDPSLVWEFYSHRRELANSKVPNAAHKTIAQLEAQFRGQDRNLTIITQNTDMLHHRAGSRNVLEMFGNLFTTRCTDCGHISNNHDIPIVSSLKGRGDPDGYNETPISIDLLPRCEKCEGLLRPHVVWYGEGMDYSLLSKVDHALRNCDLYIVVGSSSQIYPAANYGPFLAARGVPVAEFNRDETQVTDQVHFHFAGNCRDTLPQALLNLPLS